MHEKINDNLLHNAYAASKIKYRHNYSRHESVKLYHASLCICKC